MGDALFFLLAGSGSFFVFHQPVIIILAYFAVQWQTSLLAKLLFVVISSVWVTLALYEFLIRRIALFSQIFGMKVLPRPKALDLR